MSAPDFIGQAAAALAELERLRLLVEATLAVLDDARRLLAELAQAPPADIDARGAAPIARITTDYAADARVSAAARELDPHPEVRKLR